MLIGAILPIYILVFAGFVLAKAGYLPGDVIRPTNLVVVRILVPVLIFLVIFQMNENERLSWPFIFGYGAASLVTMLLVMFGLDRFFGMSASRAGLLSLGAAGSNTIFIGYPLMLALFTPLANTTFSWVLIVENMLLIPLSFILYDALSSGRSKWLTLCSSLAKNPILIAILLGLILPYFINELWQPLERALEMIKSATAGIALLLIGGILARTKFSEPFSGVALVVLGKLILHPALVLLAFIALGVDGEMRVAAVAYASVSTFAIYANFCEFAKEGQFGASVFALSTVLAPLTMTFWLEFVISL